ncbi:MAG: FkbM family methyltransferase [Gammaproteobacteria bacterium]|nr:MAG: FkbM family methyltransferase [Gammaproteobacteria bacterium]
MGEKLANKAWKNFEQSDGFRKAKLKFRQLTGKEPTFKLDVALNTEDYSGWPVVADLIQENDIVYSLGVCDDIKFDLKIIADKQVQVFAFDPTPYSIDWINSQQLPDSFHFYPWAASDSDGTFLLYPRVSRKGNQSKVMYSFHQQQDGGNDKGISVDAFTLETMVKKLGHKHIDILKMDIEGAEYGVIENLLASAIRPKMILIEFHHRFKGIGKEKTIQAVNLLNKANYLIASISATGREICFVNDSFVNKSSII